MATFIVSTSEIESTIRSTILDIQGNCFGYEVIKCISNMVSSYNRFEASYLLDALLEAMPVGHDAYPMADAIADEFIRLVTVECELPILMLDLEYFPQEEAIIVKHIPRPTQSPVKNIIKKYQDGVDQGDFYPERVHKAIKDILSTEI